MFSGYCGWDNSQELGKVLTQPHAGGSAEKKKKKKKTARESATDWTRNKLKCKNWFSTYLEEYVRNWKLLSMQHFEC